MRHRLLAALLFAGFTAAVAGQQAPAPAASQDQPPVTFRVEVNYVEVDAVVTDAQGRVVTDLTPADFEVLEDGRPQTVTAFSLVNLPIERPVRPLFAGAPIEADVRVNTEAEGRIYVIVLDDLHTSFTSTPRVKRFLGEFVEQRLGVNDLAAIVYTSGRATAGQEFTNNRRLLLEAIDRFSGRRLRSEALEINDSLVWQSMTADPEDERRLNLLDPLAAERAHNARSMLTAVRDLAAFMEGIRGRRKSILLVSEGISYDVNDVFANTSAGLILDRTREAVAAATRANVAIYAVDPRGLSAFEETIDAAGTPAGITPSEFSVVGSLQNYMVLSQRSLQVLANETGGFAAVNRNDFAGAFERIVRENSTYYVLGYNPTNDRRDGRFRRIEVRVARPGLQVRSRRGYVAPRGRAPDTGGAAADALNAAAGTALNSPVPLAGIPLSVSAAAYKGTAPDASVAITIEMRADAFGFAEKGNAFLDRVEVAFSALDAAGTVRPGQRHVLNMEMSAATTARTRARGFRVVSQIALPPGRYQLRVAAAEEGASRSGSAFYDLEVPDFYKAPFSMSGVALTAASAVETPTVRPGDPLGDLLPGPPTTVREFERGDVLALFSEFYENASAAAPSRVIDLTTTVRADDGSVVFQSREERSSTEVGGSGGGYGYSVQIPLRDVAPGTYVIRVEGRPRAADGGAARDVLIRVR